MQKQYLLDLTPPVKFWGLASQALFCFGVGRGTLFWGGGETLKKAAEAHASPQTGELGLRCPHMQGSLRLTLEIHIYK